MTAPVVGIIGVLLAVRVLTAAQSQSAELHPFAVRDDGPPEVLRLTATTLGTYEAPDARQGVAVDARHFYAIDNTTIAKFAIEDGRPGERWTGPRDGLIRHLNSCFADRGRLWCANSNYSLTPHAASVEIFDSGTLHHVESHSLGMLDEGSLTWFDRFERGWITGFAHYDGSGGVPFKNHSFSSVVVYDAEWRRKGGWLYPASVLERMAPYAASGGAIGPDGWLYLLGHDRPEMYVVGRPPMGPTLIHIATIELEARGQAFSWARGRSRTIFTIDRQKGVVRRIGVPVIGTVDPRSALKFR